MEKCFYIFSIIASMTLAILVESVSAQTSRTKKVALSVGGGVVIPQAELKSGSMSLLIFNTRKGYALSQPGFNIASKIKLDTPALPVTLVGLISYSFLPRDTTITVFSPFHDPSNEKVDLSGQIITLGAGFEYGFFSRSQIKPYVGSDAGLSLVSGKAENLPYGISSKVKVKSALRFGVGVGFGCQVDIPSWPFALEVEAKYRLANLLGKAYNTPVFVNAETRHLNDGKNPDDPTDRTRSINYISIYVGFVF